MAARKHLILLLAVVVIAACASVPRTAPPRVSDLALQGDDVHRASQRLVLEGLDADVAGDSARARARFGRALQIDASNPWAYLALARSYVDAGDGATALSHVDRAQALLETQADASPGATLHCDGLRGAALALLGRPQESRALLDSAARAAPGVWGDHRLSAAELR